MSIAARQQARAIIAARRRLCGEQAIQVGDTVLIVRRLNLGEGEDKGFFSLGRPRRQIGKTTKAVPREVHTPKGRAHQRGKNRPRYDLSIRGLVGMYGPFSILHVVRYHEEDDAAGLSS